MSRVNADLEKNILSELESSGFPLENATFRDFHESGWIVSPNLHFTNREGEDREIDAFAATVPGVSDAGAVGIICVVECKRSKASPWVFFESAYEPALSTNVIERLIVLSDLEPPNAGVFLGTDLSTLVEHHYADPALTRSRTYFEAFAKRRPSEIYAATSGLLYAVEFVRAWFSSDRTRRRGREARTFMLLPIIVFEGELFTARQVEEEWQLFETNHVQLRVIDCVASTTKSPLPDNEVIVDVVRKPHLPNWIARCDAALGEFRSHVEFLHARGEFEQD